MKRILVIDDDELIRNALQAMLEKRRFTVRTAADGAEGLRKLVRRPVDLIFVDIFMPSMDGFEFLRALRACDQHTPVIVMSGMGVRPACALGGGEAPDYLRMARELGAVGALHKPFSPGELSSALLASFGVSDEPARSRAAPGGEPDFAVLGLAP